MAQLNQVVANPSKEEVTNQIYPLTVKETADAYHAHATLKTLPKMQQRRLIIVILMPLQRRAIAP